MVLHQDTRAKPLIRNLFKIRVKKKGSVSKIRNQPGSIRRLGFNPESLRFCIARQWFRIEPERFRIFDTEPFFVTRILKRSRTKDFARVSN
jgi:hypothetical protein